MNEDAIRPQVEHPIVGDSRTRVEFRFRAQVVVTTGGSDFDTLLDENQQTIADGRKRLSESRSVENAFQMYETVVRKWCDRGSAYPGRDPDAGIVPASNITRVLAR